MKSLKNYLLAAIFVAAMFITPHCSAQIAGNVNLFTNSVAASSTSNSVAGVKLALRSNQGLALAPSFVIASASTATVTFGFNVSVDGTNWSTSLPITTTFAANGTNTVIGYTNIPPLYLNNARYLRLDQIVNGTTNTLTVNKIIYGYFP